MRSLEYRFSKLCGRSFSGANLLFSKDGNTVFSVVGNRVLLFDLVKGVCSALPAQARKNITAIATDPQGTTLIAVDEDGKAILVSLAKRTVMTHFNFKGSVRCLKFSPDGRFLAVGIGKIVSVYKSPQLSMEFCPFHLFKSFSGPVDDILSLDWSKESKFLAVGSKDLTARVYAIDVDAGVRLRRLTLSGHRDYVVSVGFIDDTRLVSVARDGALFMWNILLDEAEGIFRSEFESKHLFPKQESGNGWTQIISADVFSSPGATLVVAGSSSGVFTIYSLPDFEQVHSLSISGHQISSVKMNPSGDWIAFGCPHLGQLLVWEWKSETYVLKQQGHLFDMKCLAYSPDGSLIATGGDDGKVKIWNASSGYCFVTFSDHTCSISDIAFSSRGNVVFSASLDGTVRAYDLVRYRCFRTFTAPSESIVQFTSVVCDPSGDIVCAGAMDPFEVFVWSLRTGQLLDVLSGHEGPISGLAFNTNRSLLVSSSWDKSVKVWDVFSTKTATETLMHGSDVVAVASSPCGNFICSSNLAGQLCFWDLATGEQVGLIEGKKDILGGRKRDDRRTWKNATDGLWFSTVAYSPDGSLVIAGGSSKYVCLYDVRHRTLVKKFQISENQSLDGVLNYLSSRDLTDAGPKWEIDDVRDEKERVAEEAYASKRRLPGVKIGDFSSRRTNNPIRSMCVRFCPTSLHWADVTTEGLVIYSLESDLAFDPIDLDIDLTPQNLLSVFKKGECSKALLMSLRMNEQAYIGSILENIPVKEIPLVISSIPERFLGVMMEILGKVLDSNPVNLEYLLVWSGALLSTHGILLRRKRAQFGSSIRKLRAAIDRLHKSISEIACRNLYTIDFITSKTSLSPDQCEPFEDTRIKRVRSAA